MSSVDSMPRRFVYLLPGSLHCAAAPTVISTILGSCVSICLWDPVHRLGGMNHYVLPGTISGRDDARYGEFAIDHLVDGMEALGCRARGLVAKVFGGAAVLSVDSLERSVGTMNLQLALERLAARRINVVGRRTGGVQGLLVRFATDLGEAMLRNVPIQHAATAADRQPAGR